MKILVSTDSTQGNRRNDFCHTNEGEFLLHGFECERETVDGPCGCRRSFSGMDTHKATTTFKIIESNLTRPEFTDRLTKSLISAGFYKEPLNQKSHRDISSMADKLLDLAAQFPVGAILERRGDKISTRRITSQGKPHAKSRGL